MGKYRVPRIILCQCRRCSGHDGLPKTSTTTSKRLSPRTPSPAPATSSDCWSTSADSNTPGEGVAVYEDGAEVFNLLETFNGEYSLYAHWTPITYHIIYNANRGGGTGEGDMQPQLFTYATPQALTANAFTRTGYSFTGWNMRPDGMGRALTDGQVVDSLVTVAGRDTTLYAQWQANTYHVAFHRNNLRATGDMDLQAFTYDQEQALAANLFQHPDSSFLGWSTDSTSTVVIYSDRQLVVNLTAEPADTLALYAVWGGRNTLYISMPMPTTWKAAWKTNALPTQ